MSTLAVPQKNLYSEELKKVLYFGNSTNSLCSPIERNSMVNDANRVDSQTGIKCLCVSPDGRHLAAGGRDGNIQLVIFFMFTLKFL